MRSCCSSGGGDDWEGRESKKRKREVPSSATYSGIFVNVGIAANLHIERPQQGMLLTIVCKGTTTKG